VGDLAGRLVELSGQESPARLTTALGLVLEAQLSGERVAWVTFESSAFFPPDAAAGGVDLEALPVVRIPTALAAARAAEHLVRSGGFGLVVIDLASDTGHAGHTSPAAGAGRCMQRPYEGKTGRAGHTPPAAASAPAALLPVPMLTRLLGLARTHQTAVVILTEKSPEAPSLNALISLRAEAQRGVRKEGSEECSEGHYEVRVRAIKDKRHAPGWEHVEACRGTVGMR
jgi:recombination protein RecA